MVTKYLCPFIFYKSEKWFRGGYKQHYITLTMCFRVACKTCGKYGWGGCGEHLKTLYASIETGKHCMCRSWPGVVIPSSHNPSASTTTTTTAATNTTATAGS
ncbi:hypothetical protein Hanom_Chr15g01375761 [Helianthus anomalus]